ncbi:MAG: hypothetical protein JXB14_03650 [Candidatus Altiarchaeota archaeon]|nr:hypothetical protein [Candidatus Altiarchaeota archaeon]
MARRGKGPRKKPMKETPEQRRARIRGEAGKRRIPPIRRRLDYKTALTVYRERNTVDAGLIERLEKKYGVPFHHLVTLARDIVDI